MEVEITLSNSGGQLDAHTLTLSGDAEKDSLAIQALISTWTLASGDTITIQDRD